MIHNICRDFLQQGRRVASVTLPIGWWTVLIAELSKKQQVQSYYAKIVLFSFGTEVEVRPSLEANRLHVEFLP